MATTKRMLKGLRTAAVAAAMLAVVGSFGLVGHASADGGNTITFARPAAANQISFSAPASAGTMTLMAPEPSQSTGTMTLMASEPSQNTGTMTLLAPEPNTGSETATLNVTSATADTGSYTGN